MIRLKSLKAQGIKNLKIPAEDDDFDKLEFPEEGKVFIHGLNEAGKSTLFESIYFALFGTALIPDRSKASMSELLAYDRDKGVVELEFTVEDSLYRIRRTIDESTSRTKYGHQLVIEHPDKDPEGVKGARQVNQRIEQELGLDGDALLNSCFVQQKNLDRLEDSSRARREESIATLLNLDRFTTMENDYSSKQDTAEEELERAEQKREIAEIEEEKIPEKEQEKEQVESKLDVIQWKKDINDLEGDIEGYRSRIQEQVEEIHERARKLQEIDEIEEGLPAKKERKEQLDQLHTDLGSLEELDEARGELDDLESLNEKMEKLDGKVSELEDEEGSLTEQLETVKGQLAQYEYLESLGEWERLKNAATREDRIEEEEEEYREKKRQAEAELKQVKDQQSDVASKRRTYLGAGAVVALIGIVGVVVSPFTLIATVLGLGVAGYGYLSFDPDEFDSKIDSLDEKVEEHDTELTKLEGRKDDLSETEAEDPEKELQQVEQQIEELDRPLPSTLDECSDLKSEAEEKLEDIPDKSELESEEERLREQRSEKREEIRSKKDDLEAARKERESYAEDEIKDQISSLKQEIVGEEQDRDEIAATLEERAEDLYVEADKETVNSAKASLQTEIRNDKEQIENREDIQDQIEEKNDRIGELRSEIDGANDEIASLKENIEEADADPDIEQEEELNGERDQIVGKLGDLRGRRDDLREELNISEELELDKVKDEVQEKEHEMQLYDYAEEIVSKSKDQIMRNILPKTEANMARFLPILTNGRYKDVRIDADSYTIEAYDGRAQAYKSKSIFSGGTKDQFSLALRLSFAMATLPQERGTAPDFLYLDEPVGSFDSSRQEALTELLTRGEIAENFGQIFIVSHVEGLQEEFDHRIEMEDGRIADMELEA